MAQDSLTTYQRSEVVITATRTEKKPADVGRSVSLLTKDQIKNSLFNSVGELISGQGGMYIVGAGQNPGMAQSIFMRGEGNNKTTLMVDDVRLTDPSTVNNAPDVAELSLAGADRIEIVRGLHSTLYGSSAIGGVVNILTQKNSKPGFNADGEIRTGTFGAGTSTYSENVFLNYTDPFGFYLNTEFDNTNVNGLDATVDTVTNPALFNKRDKDGFGKKDFLGKAGFKNKALDFYASYKRTDQKSDIDKRAYIDDNNSTVDFKRNLFTYGASYRVSDGIQVKYVGGYSDVRRVAVDDSSVVDASGTTDHAYSDGTYGGIILSNELQEQMKFKGFEGILGAGQYKETMGSTTHFYSSEFGGFESNSNLDTLHLNTITNSLFVHLEFNGGLVNEMFEKFSLALGGRLHHHSTYGSKFTYEINPSVKISDYSLLYASYATGFTAPSLYQLFSPDKYYLSDITRGNKNLKPEVSSSYEIGFKQTILDHTSLSLNYFNTTGENTIEYVYLWDKHIGIDTLGNNYLRDDYRGDTYLNLGKQTTDGIELSMNSNINNKLQVVANISLVSGTLTYVPSDIDNAQTEGNHVQIYGNGAFITKQVESVGLVRRPTTANITVVYTPVDWFVVRTDARYVGSRSDIFYDSHLGPFGALGTTTVGRYTLFDISMKYIFDQHFSFGAKIENAFDTNYSEINGFTTRGRGIYIDTRFSL
jgi:vitamin B12 transporter